MSLVLCIMFLRLQGLLSICWLFGWWWLSENWQTRREQKPLCLELPLCLAVVVIELSPQLLSYTVTAIFLICACPSSHPVLDPVLLLIGTCPNKHPSLSDSWILACLYGTSFPWGTSFHPNFSSCPNNNISVFFLTTMVKYTVLFRRGDTLYGIQHTFFFVLWEFSLAPPQKNSNILNVNY